MILSWVIAKNASDPSRKGPGQAQQSHQKARNRLRNLKKQFID